jgi:formylglycine-generating enzyme required for sulfatase activity
MAVGGAGFAAEPATWRDAASGIEFVRIVGGCFEQGAASPGPANDGMPIPVPRNDEVPTRHTCVDGFWLGRTEVTRAQWVRILGAGGDVAEPDRPHADVGSGDVQNFLDALNRIATGSGRLFRLPSEAEWEYACHAGIYRSPVQLYGQERYAWMQEMADFARYRHPLMKNPRSSPVAQKKPNAWGLFDMLGNVWEWTADRYDPQAYRRGPREMLAARDAGGDRVVRGGSYMSDIAHIRCGARNAYPADQPLPVIGLRVLMETN